MLIFLLVYFVPFTICILFAKFDKDPTLCRHHLVKCAIIPIGNIVTMTSVVYTVVLNMLLKWVK